MADDIDMNEAFEYVFGQPEQIADGIQAYNLPTPPHEVCMWCIKFSHDITNGSGNYDECVEGCVTMSETEGWTDKDNKDNFHACLTLEYDMGADKPWVDRCDCTGLHYESSKDFWGRVGLA